jgi:Phage P22-like portal protein
MAGDDDDILKEAKARFERCETWERQARTNAKKDAKFANGDPYNLWMWDDDAKTSRGGRPMLTNNKVRQHNLQIINDARQNKAQIKVTPTGGRATYEAAQVFAGIIRRIEYQSKAVDAYSTAIYHQVESGIGYVRVETDYIDQKSFDLELFVRRVSDPDTIYLDPDAKQFDKADMRFAFVFEDRPRDLFEEEYGENDTPPPAAFDHTDGWNDRDHVRIAEYWVRNDAEDTLHLLDDGSMLRDSDLEAGERAKLKPRIVKSRKIAEPEVQWYRIVGNRIEEKRAWPGKYIPIVPFIGEETVISNELDRKGHTRAQIDPQKMYNYWSSAAVEQVALQTKSPYIASTRAIENYEEYWTNANVRNYSVLPYNDIDDDNRPIERPQREQPPVMAQAYVQGMQLARDDIMSVTGQYQAELGMPSNERSGIAIQQRQRQGDNATYHYIDNQAKGIRQVGRILLDLIPRVYDVARAMRIMAEDGSESEVHLVPQAPDAHQHVMMTPQGPQPITPGQAKGIQQQPDDQNAGQPDVRVIFNPLVGRYDVEADVGPAFGTRRQEAFNAFSQIMSQNQQAFPIVGDFWAQNADFPGAEELADRLKRGLPPQYQPGPSPQVQQLQQQLQAISQHGQQLAQQADAEVASLKAQVVHLQEQAKDKGRGIDIDDYKAETERLKAVAAADPAAAQVLIRSMLSDLLGMPALPVMHEHQAADAAHQQAIAPAEEPAVNGADTSGGQTVQ